VSAPSQNVPRNDVLNKISTNQY